MMKKAKHILTKMLTVVLAVLSLAISGKYVAFITTCESMNQQEVSINEKHSNCCGDITVGNIAGLATIASNGCCKVEVKDISVDSFTSNVKQLLTDAGGFTFVPYTTLPAEIGSSNGYEHAYSIFTPPDIGPLTGSDIIFTISRQLRI